MLARVEERIATAINTTDVAAVSAKEDENMIRLLGAHRGVSEAVIAFAECAAAIDWNRLREARF